MKKRTLSLAALILALCLALTGCGQSEEAKAADELIAAIGEVTLESEAQIIEAEEAVAALSEEDRNSLKNDQTLTDARAAYEALVVDQAASEVEEAISAIGTVTLESGEAIQNARTLYDGSEADVQAAVENIADLEAAETELSTLKVEEATNLITAIGGTVTLDSAAAVEAAQAAYDALTSEQQSQVANSGDLNAAITQLDALQQEQAQSLLDAMRVEDDPVRNMAFYFPQAFPYYTDIRSFVLPYIGTQDGRYWMNLRFNYTAADNWVFFETVTLAVDDERYYEYFNYFDVTRDNDTEVWEYVDMDVGEEELEMLKAIADSETTIIRFEGDDYYSDFTVSASDKEAIRQMVTAYEALT